MLKILEAPGAGLSPQGLGEGGKPGHLQVSGSQQMSLLLLLWGPSPECRKAMVTSGGTGGTLTPLSLSRHFILLRTCLPPWERRPLFSILIYISSHILAWIISCLGKGLVQETGGSLSHVGPTELVPPAGRETAARHRKCTSSRICLPPGTSSTQGVPGSVVPVISERTMQPQET